MIYLHQDMSDIEYLLIYDNTTPVAVLKLPLKLCNCTDPKDWYYWIEEYVNKLAKQHQIDNVSAKAIKFYDGKELL